MRLAVGPCAPPPPAPTASACDGAAASAVGTGAGLPTRGAAVGASSPATRAWPPAAPAARALVFPASAFTATPHRLDRARRRLRETVAAPRAPGPPPSAAAPAASPPTASEGLSPPAASAAAWSPAGAPPNDAPALDDPSAAARREPGQSGWARPPRGRTPHTWMTAACRALLPGSVLSPAACTPPG